MLIPVNSDTSFTVFIAPPFPFIVNHYVTGESRCLSKKEQTATSKTVCHNLELIKYDALANHPKIPFV